MADDWRSPADRRDDGTLATTVWAVGLGARIVRVHDVRSTTRTVALFDVMDQRGGRVTVVRQS